MTTAGASSRAALIPALVLATAVPLLRQRGVPVWESVWAEDATEFAAAVAADAGVLHPLQSHGGYAQLAPRLVSSLLDVLPLRWWSEYLAVASATAWAALAAFVYRASAELIDSRLHRLALAAFVVAAPVLGFESTANVANLQAILLFAGAWAVLPSGGGTAWTVSRSAVAVLAVLSSPLAVLVLPVVRFAVAGRPRARSERHVVTAAAIAIGLQAVIAAAARGVDGMADVGAVGNLPGLFVERVVGSSLFGDWFMTDVMFRLPRGVAIGMVLLVGVVATACLVERRHPSNRAALAFVAAAALAYGVPVVLRADQFHQRGFGFGSRYAVAPVLLLTSSALMQAARHANRAVRAGTVVWLVVVVASSFSVWTPRSMGPRWEAEIDAAFERCSDSRGIVAIEVPPAGWRHAALPCDVLVEERTATPRP